MGHLGSLGIVGLVAATLMPSAATAAGQAPAAKGGGEVRRVLPLAVGNRWTYEVVKERQSPEGGLEVSSSDVTVRIVSTREIRGLRAFAFEMAAADGRRRGFSYVLDGAKVYDLDEAGVASVQRDGAQALDRMRMQALKYVFPLTPGSRWGDPEMVKRQDGKFSRFVAARGDVETPAGSFKGCTAIRFVADDGEELEWLCRGVGMVRYEFVERGLQNEVWELKEYRLRR